MGCRRKKVKWRVGLIGVREIESCIAPLDFRVAGSYNSKHKPFLRVGSVNAQSSIFVLGAVACTS